MKLGKIVIVILFVLFLLVVIKTYIPPQIGELFPTTSTDIAPVEKQTETISEPVKETAPKPTSKKVEPAPKLGCTDTAECEANEQCIERVCSTIEELYDTDCSNKCNFDSVVIDTSDGETYTFNRGRGAYTFAGALNWKLLTGPDYCPGDKVIVPFEIEKVSYGEVLNTQTIIVSPGETSDRIDHPTISRVDFTLEVTSINEECS